MRKEVLLQLLQGDKLDVDEEAVFEGVIAWANANKSDTCATEETIAPFIPLIRFGAMKLSFLRGIAATSSLLFSSSAVKPWDDITQIIRLALQAHDGTVSNVGSKRARSEAATDSDEQPAIKRMRRGARVFAYKHPFDKEGLLYWYWLKQEDKKIRITSSDGKDHELAVLGHDHNNKTQYEVIKRGTTGNKTMWFTVDLGEGRAVIPSHYCLRSGRSKLESGRLKLRSWKLQGSNDPSDQWKLQGTWQLLRSHKSDQWQVDRANPSTPFTTAAWPIEGIQNGYRFFRVLSQQKAETNTGYSFNGTDQLSCGGFEIFGTFVSRSK
jgi:hypothetical protein